jgi:uncharacterized protein YndB with AHSA1/START domain
MTALRLERRLAAPQGRVWAALTDPAELAAWFWPARATPTAEVDLRVGGRFRIVGPGMGIAVSGVYRTVEVPRRLAFTWQWDGDPTETFVTVDLVPDQDGTLLTIRHEGFVHGADRDAHAEGWADCLGRLPDRLAGTDLPTA